MPQQSLKKWFPSLQVVSLPHVPASPFPPCSFTTCPCASAPLPSVPGAAWQGTWTRDECLPAPTTRNSLKLSNMSLSIDICNCSCVLGYLGMARRSKKGLLGLHKASLGSNAHIGYFVSCKCRICISFYFFFSTGILKIFHRGTTCFEVPIHHILHVQLSPNMGIINFIINKG